MFYLHTKLSHVLSASSFQTLASPFQPTYPTTYLLFHLNKLYSDVTIQKQCQTVKSSETTMGAKQQSTKSKIPVGSDVFLSLFADPEEGKLNAQVLVPSITVLNRWSSSLEKLGETNPEHLLLPNRYKIAERSLCGESIRLEIQYPCFHIPLSQELSKRCQAEKYLQQPQMWYLVYCLVQSASCCHRLGKAMGEIKPENILLSSAGKLRILSSWSAPRREGLLIDLKNRPLCSPEQLQCLKKSYKQLDLPYLQAESFSIGMTILSAGTLQPVSKCYDYENVGINHLEFNRLLAFWHQNQFYSEEQQGKIAYSRQLKDIVMKMVELDPERRMDSSEVFDLLEKHRDDIMTLKPFGLDLSRNNSPKKRSVPKDKPNSSQEKGGASTSIHLLRSRKRSSAQQSGEKSSGNCSKMEVSNFLHHLNNQFSFNSPPSINAQFGVPPVRQPGSPARRKKINTSVILMKQRGQTFK